MSDWPATKARRVLAALLKIGWTVKRQRGSHQVLIRPGWPDVVFAFHDKDEIGPGCWPVLLKTPALPRKIYNLRRGSKLNRKGTSND